MKTYALITLLASVIFIFLGRKLSQEVHKTTTKILLGILFFLPCIPSLLYLLMPVFTLYEPIWYLEMRSVLEFELLAAFWGLWMGFITVKKPYSGKIRWEIFNKYFYFLAVFLSLAQYINYFVPMDYSSLKNQWKDAVCIQTTGYTCAPASMATLFKVLGQEKTEQEVAKALYTNPLGTNRWNLLRYARENQLDPYCIYQKELAAIPLPALLHVLVLNNIAHAITLIGKEGNAFIIGDPMVGKRLLTQEQFYQEYTFHGLAICLKNNKR